MIITRLMGGLGNQMFQYALGRRLALDRKVPFKLDLSWFRSHHDRKYLLENFKIKADIASAPEIDRFKMTRNPKIQKLSETVIRHLPFYYLFPTVKERNISFDPRILKARTDAYFIGYWQSENYFKPISSIIRTDYQLKRHMSTEAVNIYQLINSTESVSVHIRRGDYLTIPRLGICSLDYYQNAHEYILGQLHNPYFFVFSDDIKWSKENLGFLTPVCFVNLHTSDKDVEELVLMSNCQHQIIANSSYSWWGAWLNTHANKHVIAPRKWSNDPNWDTSKIKPESWIQL